MSSIEGERASRRFLRPVGVTAEADRAYHAFVDGVAARLDDGSEDRNDVVREVLLGLYGIDPDTANPHERVTALGCDPRNATLEPEYYADVDPERYARVKPIHWLWLQFDRSPAGRNLHLGVLFRRMLAQRLFKRCGKNLKVFRGAEFTYGYNLEVGDDVVIHRDVFLDDRGGIVLGNHVSISDCAMIYTHDHAITDIGDITMRPVTVGDGARITYHATILAGAHVGADAIVGAHGLLRKPVGDHEIAGGVPAKFIARKPEPGKSV